MNSRKREYLLYIAIIFLLVAQYVANDRPWDHIFPGMPLLRLAGVAALEIVRRFSGARR